MWKLYYRCKNEKGEWETRSSEKSWKTPKALFQECADWIANNNVCIYIKQEAEASTIKCPF